MTAKNLNSPAQSVERDFVITRIIDAPRMLVFKAWTDPEQFAQWWGPEDFTNPVCQFDLRPDGAYRVVMRSPTATSIRSRASIAKLRSPSG